MIGLEPGSIDGGWLPLDGGSQVTQAQLLNDCSIAWRVCGMADGCHRFFIWWYLVSPKKDGKKRNSNSSLFRYFGFHLVRFPLFYLLLGLLYIGWSFATQNQLFGPESTSRSEWNGCITFTSDRWYSKRLLVKPHVCCLPRNWGCMATGPWFKTLVLWFSYQNTLW